MPNIFLSYARQDEIAALEIYEWLVREGLSVWMDKKNLSPGQDWKTEIEKAINASDIFVACLSNQSVNKKGFVQAELKRALEVADLMPENGIFIIPVRLDDCPVPHKLASLHWLDYFVLENREQLLKAISNKINIQEKIQEELRACLLNQNPEVLRERFKGVTETRIVHALLSIAKREDEAQIVRSRAVRGMQIFASLNTSAWTELLPTASTDLLQEWISIWCDDLDETILTSDHIRILLEGGRLPKPSIGFGLAVRKFIMRGAKYTSSVFLPGTSYPAWEVKYDCVRSIIKLDDADSLRTLASFSTIENWKAREQIIDYIEKKLENGQLLPEDQAIATGVLDQILIDENINQKTSIGHKAQSVMQKLLHLSSDARRALEASLRETKNRKRKDLEDKSHKSTEKHSILSDFPYLFIVISGPSGVGKRSVIQRLKERGLAFHNLLAVTTRPPRSYEVNGEDYFFVSNFEFAWMIENNELIEYHIEYDYYVGIGKEQMQKALMSGVNTILRLDVQGAEILRRIAHQAILIFITAEGEKELIQRLKDRKSESGEELATRIAAAQEELTHAESFDYVIVNHDFHLDNTIDEIRAIITSEEKRGTRRKIN